MNYNKHSFTYYEFMKLPRVKNIKEAPVNVPFLMTPSQLAQQDALELVFKEKGEEGIHEMIKELDKEIVTPLGVVNRKSGTPFVKTGILIDFWKCVICKHTGAKQVQKFGGRLVK